MYLAYSIIIISLLSLTNLYAGIECPQDKVQNPNPKIIKQLKKVIQHQPIMHAPEQVLEDYKKLRDEYVRAYQTGNEKKVLELQKILSVMLADYPGIKLDVEQDQLPELHVILKQGKAKRTARLKKRKLHKDEVKKAGLAWEKKSVEVGPLLSPYNTWKKLKLEKELKDIQKNGRIDKSLWKRLNREMLKETKLSRHTKYAYFKRYIFNQETVDSLGEKLFIYSSRIEDTTGLIAESWLAEFIDFVDKNTNLDSEYLGQLHSFLYNRLKDPRRFTEYEKNIKKWKNSLREISHEEAVVLPVYRIYGLIKHDFLMAKRNKWTNDFLFYDKIIGIIRAKKQPYGFTSIFAKASDLSAYNSRNELIRRKLVYAVTKMKKPSGPFLNLLVLAKSDGVSSISELASSALHKKGYSQVSNFQTLQKIMKDSNSKLRPSAMRVIERLGNSRKRMLPLLIKALRDKDPLVKFFAANTLREMGKSARSAFPALLEALKDQNRRVRIRAAQAIYRMKISDVTLLPNFLNLLKNQDPVIRFWSTMSLRHMTKHTKKILPGLMLVLKDVDSQIRLAATYIVKDMGESAKSLLPLLTKNLNDPSIDVRTASTLALGKMGKDGLPSLLLALKNERSIVRGIAAGVMGKLGELSKSVLPELKLALKDESTFVRERAYKAIKQIEKSLKKEKSKKPSKD